jgi:hypothetical protein
MALPHRELTTFVLDLYQYVIRGRLSQLRKLLQLTIVPFYRRL